MAFKTKSKGRRASSPRNALHSTGPRDTSMTRLNATKHGILSSQLLIEDDERESFEAMREGLLVTCAPEGTLEELQVEVMAAAMWRWRRVLAYERQAIESMRERLPWEEVHLPDLMDEARVERYEAHVSRQFFKALHELQRLQAFRLGKPASVPEALDVSVDVGGG